VQLLDLGEHGLKDIEGPQRLFQLVVDGLPSEFPPLKSLDNVRFRPSILTLLITDITGWPHVLQTLGDEEAGAIANAYHSLVIEVVKAEGGYELEVVADMVMAAFERPRDALRASIRLRNALRTEPWFPKDERPPVKTAIHSGRVMDAKSGHLGSVAFRCVSLCRTAEPWQILVSHATEALLEGELHDLSLRDLGERTLRDLDTPVHVFEVPG
jgi:class 3 adenylate cyclase